MLYRNLFYMNLFPYFASIELVYSFLTSIYQIYICIENAYRHSFSHIYSQRSLVYGPREGFCKKKADCSREKILSGFLMGLSSMLSIIP